MRQLPVLVAIISIAVLVKTATAASSFADDVSGPFVSSSGNFDISDPIREHPGLGQETVEENEERKRERPLRVVLPSVTNNQVTTAVQGATTAPLAASTSKNFDGIGEGVNGFSVRYAPPDTTGAVGATQFVQWVNTYFAVYDKSTGAIATGFPKAGNALWAGFGGGCETNNDGDPIVQYDKAANRWVLTQFSVSTTPYLQCVAVSVTSDATGSYHRYAFEYNQFPDYPKVGIWPSAYFITFNMFGATFSGSRVCAYDRAKMLNGLPATQICFQTSTSFGSLLPSDLDGSTAPPANSPNYVFNFGTNSLNMWKFTPNFATPASSTFTGPTNIAVAAFNPACKGGACIPQQGTSNKLDSLGDRLMYRVAYRNRAQEQILISHSVNVGSGRTAYVGVRWYELRLSSGTPSVFQQGTFAPDNRFRWMSSIGSDKVGNIAMGYSLSSATMYPSIAYTGWSPGDTLGTMQTETIAWTGGGSQSATLQRWGDYSQLSIDPVDDCTFWYTTEYLKSSGKFNWNTRILVFKFPNCA